MYFLKYTFLHSSCEIPLSTVADFTYVHTLSSYIRIHKTIGSHSRISGISLSSQLLLQICSRNQCVWFSLTLTMCLIFPYVWTERWKFDLVNHREGLIVVLSNHEYHPIVVEVENKVLYIYISPRLPELFCWSLHCIIFNQLTLKLPPQNKI